MHCAMCTGLCEWPRSVRLWPTYEIDGRTKSCIRDLATSGRRLRGQNEDYSAQVLRFASEGMLCRWGDSYMCLRLTASSQWKRRQPLGGDICSRIEDQPDTSSKCCWHLDDGIESCMVHSVSGWTRDVHLKLWDHLRTRAIPERLRGVFMTRHCTNPRLPYLTSPHKQLDADRSKTESKMMGLLLANMLHFRLHVSDAKPADSGHRRIYTPCPRKQ